MKNLMALLGFCVYFVHAAPEVVTTEHPTPDVVIAEEVLVPPTSLGEDFAPALQAAIERRAKAGGGVIFLRAGEYTIASRVVVREGVTLRGDYAPGSSAASTLLRITVDRAREEAPATFTVERGSGLVAVVFWYPEQRMADPTPYPWTVKSAAMGNNDNQTITDCTFVNSWRAICIGPEGNELHTLRRLRICALKCGIAIDSVTDIGRITDVTIAPEVWLAAGLPEAPPREALYTWLLQSDSVALDVGRSDWEYIWHLEISGYQRGVVLRKGLRGTTNAVMANSRISRCGTALEVSALNQVGFSLYDCHFTANKQDFFGAAGFDSVVQFYASRLDGALLNQGTGVVSFHECDLSQAVLLAEGGQVLAQDTALGVVKLSPGVKRARLLGFDAKLARVDNQCNNGDVAICAAAHGKSERSVVRFEELPAMPRPASTKLFVVTDFGASPDKEDNAAPFQAALDLAKAQHGGTVYVPPGLYAFHHDIKVPDGVELRGCLDVPHHTVSAGSVLLIHHNHGDENGAPFVTLGPASGLRGLTFWYPKQPWRTPVPYPWTIRATGKGCWLVDVTVANAWQGVDFATHACDNHYINYLSGAMYRRGLFVANSRRGGWVADVQFNPHYALRLPQGLPHTAGEGDRSPGESVIQFQREHLEGLVFRDCHDERLFGTFLYAAFDGLAFYGSAQVRSLIHGTDTGSRALYLNTDKSARVDLALAQLVSLGDWAEAAIVSAAENRGSVSLANTQIWAGPRTAKLAGGLVRLAQFNTLSGPIEAQGGGVEILNGLFGQELKAYIVCDKRVGGTIKGVVATGPLRVTAPGGDIQLLANSLSPRPVELAPKVEMVEFYTGFEHGEPQAATDKIASPGGGVRKVSANQCAVVARDDAHGGNNALLLRGVSDDPAYSFVYHELFKCSIPILPDTVLTYRFKPLNDNGCASGLDLLMASGKPLRECSITDTEGRGTFPGLRRGHVGQWTKITVPLGKLAGNTITVIMAAYDTRKGGGMFEALFDDIRIGTELPVAAWHIAAQPVSGSVARGTKVTLSKDSAIKVRYTLDGREPTVDSPLFESPLILPRNGVVELRYTPLTTDGSLSRTTFGALYHIER